MRYTTSLLIFVTVYGPSQARINLGERPGFRLGTKLHYHFETLCYRHVCHSSLSSCKMPIEGSLLQSNELVSHSATPFHCSCV